MLAEGMMDALFYALYCFALPLWIFAGLYLALEFTEMLKQRHIKK